MLLLKYFFNGFSETHSGAFSAQYMMEDCSPEPLVSSSIGQPRDV